MMSSVHLQISYDIMEEAKIPPSEWENTLRRELAVQLYARELLPKAAAAKLADMDRLAFNDLLGQRQIPYPLTPKEVASDLDTIQRWQKRHSEKAS